MGKYFRLNHHIYLCLILVTFFTTVFYSNSEAQKIDSLGIAFAKNNKDTSTIKKLLISLIEPKIIESDKIDSLLIQLKGQSEKLNFQKGLALYYRYFGVKHFSKGDFISSKSSFFKSLNHSVLANDSILIAQSYQSLASSYFNLGKQDSAIYYCRKAIEGFQLWNNLRMLGVSYNSLGGIYWAKGDFSAAADALFKSLDIKVKLKDSIGIANTYNNIGILFDSQQKLAEALEMYQKSLEICKKKSFKRGIGRAYNNIAIVLKNLDRIDEAIVMLQKSLEIDISIGNIDDQGKTLNNIGQLFLQTNKVSTAIQYFENSRKIFLVNKNVNGEAATVINLGRAYSSLGNLKQSIIYYEQALSLSKSVKSSELINEAYNELYKVHKKLGNSGLALYYHELNYALSDSLKNVESIGKLDELKLKYESELKDSEIALLNKDKNINELTIEKQRFLNNSLIVFSGLLLLIVFLIIVGLLRIKRSNQELILKNSEINQQKEEIETQRDQMELINSTLNQQNEEMLAQRDQIELKNTIISAASRRLTENIEYASRIQKALLPDIKIANSYFKENLVIYEPKDIVSGDFYWIWPSEDKLFFSIADCTGHGVSGAFMSILAHNFLKDAISKGLNRPNDIISLISNEIENSLYSNMPSHDVKDGLDIIVCCFNRSDLTLEYSGAHSSFYHLREGLLSRYKTDRYSIGGHINPNVKFENQKIALKRGDRLVFYTDGYMDQLNVNTRKKIGSTAFKDIIQENQVLSLVEQKQKLTQFFNDWKKGYDQIDDVLIWMIEV